MTTEQPVALVTRANKGLGLETGRQLARRAITVPMGAWDIKLGRDAIDRLKSDDLTVEPVQLDVTRADHIAQVGSFEEGAKTAVRLATIGPDGPTGKFFHFDKAIPW
jgi:NAD(P)-dependent dehydrogenase (short-subunit alcohol dehydrogenase family)